MWRKFLRVLGFLIGWGVILAYIIYASHLAQEHRAEQRVTEVVITMTDSTEMQQFASSAQIRKQLRKGGFRMEKELVDSVDAVKISQYIARNGFVSDAEVYTTYSGMVYINIRQHKPIMRLLSGGYDSYVTAEGEIFRAPQGGAYYAPVVTGEYIPLFNKNFNGSVTHDLANRIERENIKLQELSNEVVKLNKSHSDYSAQRASLYKKLKRKGFFESDEAYRMRRVGGKAEIAKYDEKIAQIAGQKRKVERAQYAIELRKKKLQKKHDDFCNLINFVTYMESDSFWQAETVQFVADTTSMGDITLRIVPRSGDFTIEFGTLADGKSKLDKLEKFYEDGLSRIGWDRYSIVDIRYNKQVICTE